MFNYPTEQFTVGVASEIVYGFNAMTGHEVELHEENLRPSIGSIEMNPITNKIKRVILNKDKAPNFENNMVFVYATLHEVGHALDVHLNHNDSVEMYSRFVRKNLFVAEVNAWKFGINFGLQNHFINEEDLKNIEEFMKWCLDTYNNGNYNTTEVVENTFATIKGGN